MFYYRRRAINIIGDCAYIRDIIIRYLIVDLQFFSSPGQLLVLLVVVRVLHSVMGADFIFGETLLEYHRSKSNIGDSI